MDLITEGVKEEIGKFFTIEKSETIPEEGTNAETYNHEIDVDTSFTHGNTEQETSTEEEVAADV